MKYFLFHQGFANHKASNLLFQQHHFHKTNQLQTIDEASKSIQIYVKADEIKIIEKIFYKKM